MTIVINMFAGPGAGKSTIAAGLFHKMKTSGVKCELVTEYAKELTYENNTEHLFNGVKVLAEQYTRFHRLRNKVDFIINDSPLLLNSLYNDCPELSALAFKLFKSFTNYNVFIDRLLNNYQQYGRNQTEEEARTLDVKLENLLREKDIGIHSSVSKQTWEVDLAPLWESDVHSFCKTFFVRSLLDE